MCSKLILLIIRNAIRFQIHRLRELLDVPELTEFGPIPLLLDPETKINGIIVGTPEESM